MVVREVDTVQGAQSSPKRIITLPDLWHLTDNGFVPNFLWKQLITTVRDDRYWRLWVFRIVLILGVAHLLAGVLFFFAYNWADLSQTAKFGILFSGVGLSCLLWWLIGPDSRVGELCGVAATVLTGILMAVFGQIYQTGADAHDLFMAWALLTLPWAVISKSPIHLLVWVVIVDVAYGLFASQVMSPFWGTTTSSLLLINALVLSLIMLATSLAAKSNATLLPWWLSGVLVLGIIVHLAAAGWISVLNYTASYIIPKPSVTGLLIAIACQVTAFLYFFKLEKNTFGSVLTQAAIISTVTLLVTAKLDDIITGNTGYSFLMYSAIVAGASALFIYLARSTAQYLRGRVLT